VKAAIAILVCCLGLTACAGKSGPTPTPSPSGTTFFNRAHHFTVTYEPATFRVKTRMVADQFTLYLRAASGGVAQVTAVPMSRQFVQNELASWGKDTLNTKSGEAGLFMPWLSFAQGADKADWATLNGVRGIRVEAHTASDRAILFYVMSGSELYIVSAAAPADRWSAEATALLAVADSFRVTK